MCRRAAHTMLYPTGLLLTGLLFTAYIIVSEAVSIRPRIKYEGSSEENTSQQVGSGDLQPFISQNETSPGASLLTVKQGDMDQVVGRLDVLSSHMEVLTSQMERVEEMIYNQSLRGYIRGEHGRMYGDGPSDYKKAPTDNDKNKVEVTHAPFVLHPDDSSHFRFYGDNSSLHQDFEGWCSENQVVGLGPPKTHAWVYKEGADLGAWFKDPYPDSLSERTQIWIQRRATHIDDRYSFHLYDDYFRFRSDEATARRERAWWIHGMGSIVYRGALHFHYQNHMYRLDLRTNEPERQLRTQLLMTSDYTRGQHTYVRYHADERGLWVSYPAVDHFRLMVSRVDPATLDLTETVTLEEDIAGVKGVYLICGKVYLVSGGGNSLANGGRSGNSARAVYDVYRRQRVQGVTSSHDVTLLYGYVSQMTYNPREKVIFGWDNYHLLTWPVVWQKKG